MFDFLIYLTGLLTISYLVSYIVIKFICHYLSAK